MSNSKALILFQKRRVRGKVKTRIARTEGNEEALAIYNQLVKYTHKVSSEVNADVFVFFSESEPREDIPVGFKEGLQIGKDLGERMSNAFIEILSIGYEKAALIGTDCGELTSEIIENGFDLLNDNEVVFGPADDGGYYLIGMNKPNPDVFKDIPWSTDQVLSLTKQRAEKKGLTFALLPQLSDVDTIEDWKRQQKGVLALLTEKV